MCSLVEPAETNGLVRRQRQEYKAFAPVPFFPTRRRADDAHCGGVALIKSEAGEPGNNGLQLIVIGRPICSERNQGA